MMAVSPDVYNPYISEGEKLTDDKGTHLLLRFVYLWIMKESGRTIQSTLDRRFLENA